MKVQGVDQDLVHRVISDLMEDVSPDREERLTQAIDDVRKDIAAKQERIRGIMGRVADLTDLISLLSKNGSDPKAQLTTRTLVDRKAALEEEAESINLGKMVKKLGQLERELANVRIDQGAVDSLKELMNG